MVSASTSATAMATALRSTTLARRSRSSRRSCFESRSPRTRVSGGRMTAAATTGPKRAPRPTSSTPAIQVAPCNRAAFSNLLPQTSERSMRSLRVAAETPSSLEGCSSGISGSKSDSKSCAIKVSLQRTRLRKEVENSANTPTPRSGNAGTGASDELGLGPLDFLEARSLAAKSAQVEELGAANLGRANLLHLVDDLGVEGEDALNAMAEAHLANREAALRPILAGDDNTFEGLEAFFIAFRDLDLHAYRIPCRKRGKVGPIEFFCKPLHYWMNRHSTFLALDSELLVYTEIRVLRASAAPENACLPAKAPHSRAGLACSAAFSPAPAHAATCGSPRDLRWPALPEPAALEIRQGACSEDNRASPLNRALIAAARPSRRSAHRHGRSFRMRSTLHCPEPLAAAAS